MKVILNQDVIGLGEEGDIKEVANGYARNYLLPKKLAMPETKQNLAVLEHKRAAIEKRKEGKRLEALSLKERLEAEELKFSMPAGENGKLFGSVNNANVLQELEKKGFTVEKKRIEIPDHAIRSVGNYKIRIRLYDKEEAIVRVVIEGTVQSSAAPAAKPRQQRSRSSAHKPAEAEGPHTVGPETPPEEG
jgi:large subunit ribosomal protein L9